MRSKIVRIISTLLVFSMFQTVTGAETENITDAETIVQILYVFMAEKNIPTDPRINQAIVSNGKPFMSFGERVYHDKYLSEMLQYLSDNHVDISASGLLFSAPTEDSGQASQSLPAYILGDVTEDGTVEVDDALTALSAYTAQVADSSEPLSEAARLAADPDGDGELTLNDAQYILNYYTANTVTEQALSWVDVVVFGK